MLRSLIAAILLVFLLSPAEAAMTVKSLGTTNTSASATGVITTATNDCPIGSLIVVFAGYVTFADEIASVSDSAGNLYRAPIDQLGGTAVNIGWVYAVNTTVDLPVGGTITVTFEGAVNNAVAAVCISGAATTNPLDLSNISVEGIAQTTATTTNTGTLNHANEVILAGAAFSANPGTKNCNGTWVKTINGASLTPTIIICTLVVTTTATQAFTPSWTLPVNYITDILSFSDTATSGAVINRLGLLGVGN